MAGEAVLDRSLSASALGELVERGQGAVADRIEGNDLEIRLDNDPSLLLRDLDGWSHAQDPSAYGSEAIGHRPVAHIANIDHAHPE
jgi:hypothetical protein